MLKTLIFALAAEVGAASACAALIRAGGHKARAVDATLLTKADREAADLVFTSDAAAAIVHAAYDDKPVIVVAGFNPADFLPERIALAEAWVRGEEGEPPTFGKRVAPVDGDGLRTDGPTVDEFVAAGYLAANYPPAGYASRSTDEEVSAAVAAQAAAAEAKKQSEQAAGEEKFTAAQLREVLTAKGIAFKANAPKAELQALVDAANTPT